MSYTPTVDWRGTSRPAHTRKRCGRLDKVTAIGAGGCRASPAPTSKTHEQQGAQEPGDHEGSTVCAFESWVWRSKIAVWLAGVSAVQELAGSTCNIPSSTLTTAPIGDLLKGR